jgi:hypothetical protein
MLERGVKTVKKKTIIQCGKSPETCFYNSSTGIIPSKAGHPYVYVTKFKFHEIVASPTNAY